LISLGFDQQNFDRIVSGIFKAIQRAHENLEPGTIRIAASELNGVSKNRSPGAYARNPDARPGDDTDRLMTLLRFDGEQRSIGSLNWFAVHGTSLDNRNRLISGDNKGYASYLFERDMKNDYTEAIAFVAAFAQANEGDVSPNVSGGKDSRGDDQFASLTRSGEAQYRHARGLYESAIEVIEGGVDYRQAYFDFSGIELSSEWASHDLPVATAPSALGVSKLAGTLDGRGVPFIKQGIRTEDLGFIYRTFLHLIVHVLFRLRLRVAPSRSDKYHRRLARRLPWRFSRQHPQEPKPIFCPLGELQPPWTPQVLPLQIVRLGQLAIIAVPFECTTVAGRRIRATVEARLRPAGVTHSVIAGLSNAYAGYCTTPEDYAHQNYEGASTEFGKAQLPAVQQSLDGLANDLLEGIPTTRNLSPPRVKPGDFDLNASLWLDLGKFGKVTKEPRASYRAGEWVKVSFRSGHPNNNMQTQSSYMELQREEGNVWQAVAHDWEPETRYRWKRWFWLTPWSYASFEWQVPPTAAAGRYRVQHRGHYKPWRKAPRAYEGITREFRVG
jgi:neutral ceramidase